MENMQLELPFFHVLPWDGQYTFTHWLAKRCFEEAAQQAKEAGNVEVVEAFNLGSFKQYDINVWAYVLNLEVENLP